MRLQVLSDLHFELHADDGASFVDSLDPTGIDVLIIAGDLAVSDGVGGALDRFCARYATATVLYVHGNHEFYGATREHVKTVTRAACARHTNLRWLDCHVVTVAGRRFLGAPLWFRDAHVPWGLKVAMNDFHQIPDFERWVYRENARALRFLERELAEGDVVITHHLPAESSVSPAWRGSALNPFFVCDVEPLIRARRPAAWVHGHTHDSIDGRIGTTRVLCNPFGYVPRALNAAFQDRAVLDLAPA